MPVLARPADGPDARREQAAGARLPYARHVDDATVETRDGRLIQFLKLEGFPFETADTTELNYRKTVRDTMLRGVASSRFALYHHVVRREVRPELSGDFPDDFSRSLDAAWRGRLASRRLYVNDLFLTPGAPLVAGRGRGAGPRVRRRAGRRTRPARDRRRRRPRPGRAQRRARRPALGAGPLRRAPAHRLRRAAGRVLGAAGVPEPALQRRGTPRAPAQGGPGPLPALSAGELRGGRAGARLRRTLARRVRGHGVGEGLPPARPHPACSTTCCACRSR